MSAENDAAGPPADELGKEAKAAEPASSSPGSDEKPGLGGKDRKSAAEDDSTAARESTEQLASLENHFHNTNIFNAPVDGSRATFGLAGGLNRDDTHRRTRTGRLPSEEAADLCGHFAAPPLYRDAAKALKQDRVVVLAGASGLGKRTSAIRLLLDTGAEALEIVSPTLTLEDLSKHDFAAKHGYLVEDWQHAPRSDGASDYNWRLLRDHVIDSEVYLVITTATGKAGRSVTQFAWEAPTAEHVLKAHLADGVGLADEAAADAADEVAGEIPDTYPGRFSIGAVAALGRRLAAPGASFPEIVREIQQELSSDPGRYVREWLADEARTDDDFRRATALCFAAGRSERIFEVMLMRLESALRDSGLAEEEVGQNAKNGEDDVGQDAPAVRRGAGLGGLRTRRKANGLLEREGGKVRFQGREAPQQYLYHRYTVQELWRDFDMNFWIAIRDWLAELIGDTAIRDVQVSVAAGLAMLAFDALDEVEGSYLHPWANGEQAWSGQCTAVYVLWLMARDDSLSPVALRIATDWVNSGSPACQWTAAAALSGELGTAYPATAAARLWHLVGQWRDVPTKAVIALAGLFATLTRVREGQEAYQVLTLLQERLSRARGRLKVWAMTAGATATACAGSRPRAGERTEGTGNGPCCASLRYSLSVTR